jgi:hypothetical protein
MHLGRTGWKWLISLLSLLRVLATSRWNERLRRINRIENTAQVRLMSTAQNALNRRIVRTVVTTLTLGLFSMPSANAVTLTAPANGTFTMNLDSTALAPYSGYFLSTFWDAGASDFNNPANTGGYFASHVGNSEIFTLNSVFELTPIGSDPSGQALDRHVKATSSNFFIDTDSLLGVDSVDGPLGRTAGAQIGMTGVQGFYAPYWLTACCGLGGGLINGDFSIVYDSERQSAGQSGWYLNNNIYFPMATYDFGNLTIAYSDADNWSLTGDLLMSPENGGMLRGEILKDVGDFCLGAGSSAGCGQVVPVPAAIWLFGSGLVGLMGVTGRKQAEKNKFKLREPS